ncbi:MAG: PH domain-containing protein [Propionibacteriales bacterium]|nr:PH domain-containing protein [Propionibacteriales bacterium]
MKTQIYRPRVLIITYAVFAVLLLVGSFAFWFGLDPGTRVRFNWLQIANMVFLVALLLVLFGALAFSVVLVDERGLMVRNAFRVWRLPWSTLHSVVLREGDTFATLLLLAHDAHKEPARRMLFGLQSVDGARTVEAVRQINADIVAHRRPAPEGRD